MAFAAFIKSIISMNKWSFNIYPAARADDNRSKSENRHHEHWECLSDAQQLQHVPVMACDIISDLSFPGVCD